MGDDGLYAPSIDCWTSLEIGLNTVVEVMTRLRDLSPALADQTFILCAPWSDSGSPCLCYYLVFVLCHSAGAFLYTCGTAGCYGC